MHQNFTLENKLTAYLYNEIDILDKILVEVELKENPTFMQQYIEMKEGISLIENEEIELKSPSTASVELIEMIASLNFDSMAES